MLRTIAALALILGLASGCDKFPNGTETKLNWYECPDSNTPIYSLKLTDANGAEQYPVKLTEILYVNLDVDNKEDHSNLRLDIDVFSWGGWGGCSWHKVPTFGLLNNLNACEHGVPCPIKAGRQNVKIQIDFTKYGKIIGLLKDNAPYQIQYKLTDRSTTKTTCSIVQAKAKTRA